MSDFQFDELKHHELQQVYRWIDQISLSRPKRHIARDFGDGVLMAEVVANFFPRLVDLHNYSQGNSVQQKQYNWDTLNMKVFKKMDYQVDKNMAKAIIAHKQGAIEKVLFEVQRVLAQFQEKGGDDEDKKSTGDKKKKSPEGGMLNPIKGVKSPSGGAKLNAAVPGRSSGGGAAGQLGGKAVDPAIQAVLAQKDTIISDLRETVDILTLKVAKLEQLVKLKNQKISTLARKLDQVNLGAGTDGI